MNDSGSRLLQFLSPHTDVREEELSKFLAQKTTNKQIKKGTFLLQEGQICQHSFFVERGLLRFYSIDNKGKEHIIQFAPENWFVTDRESVFYKEPSSYFIDSLEDSTIRLLSPDFFSELSVNSVDFVSFNTRLLHNHIRHLQKRINLLLSATAEQRYLEFISTYPDLLARVPQTMISSYLGITPESLSRVRKELALKNVKK